MAGTTHLQVVPGGKIKFKHLPPENKPERQHLRRLALAKGHACEGGE